MSSSVWLGAFVLGCVWSVGAIAQNAQPPGAAMPSVEIAECVVFSESDSGIRHDCTAKARELCSAAGSTDCALPIGLVLSGGKDLDGDRTTWEKVRVKFRCGKVERINGPHHQNDHATALLACGGG